MCIRDSFNTNSKYSTYVSFILLGLLFWIRFSGLLFVAPFIISHFLIHRDLKKLVICCFLFLLIISPILVSRDEQYDNPLFFPISVGDEKEFKSIPDRFDPNWFQTSFGNLFYALGIMSVPFLIFLFPIGMLLSIKTSENKKNFLSIRILLILTFIPMLIQYFIGTISLRGEGVEKHDFSPNFWFYQKLRKDLSHFLVISATRISVFYEIFYVLQKNRYEKDVV